VGKHIALFLLTVGMGVGVASVLSSAKPSDLGNAMENYPYIEQMILESSRYTQPEPTDPAVMQNYHDRYSLHYTETELETLGFVEMFPENDEIAVYFEKDSFSIVVENKITGYFWSSRPEFQGYSGMREDTPATRNQMNSGLWIGYVSTDNLSSAGLKTDSLYALAEVEYANNGSVTVENPDRLRPFYIKDGTYDTRKVTTAIVSQTGDSFTVHIDAIKLGIAFDVEIRLTEEHDIAVRIPSESISETHAKYRLMSLSVFPYFGSAREDEMPGYLMIPDGVGTLIRTDRRYNTYFQADFYGDDFGYDAVVIPQLSVPIFGIVHEAGANGFYAEVNEGAEHATLVAYLWGDKTRYDRLYTRFNYRQIYLTVINKAGKGNDTIAPAVRKSDFSQTYHLLSEEKASYVGMATDYRDILRERGILSDKEKTVGNQIPIQLSYIMGDQEPAFLGTSRVTMTTPSQVRDSYEDFRRMGILNQQIQLCGWSRDGFVNRTPYTTSVAGKTAYQDLIADIRADGNEVYLYNDYVTGSEWSPRVSVIRDVAKDLSRLKIVRTSVTLDGQETQLMALEPLRSLAMAQQDADFYADLGVGLALDSLGSTLFAYYDGAIHERGEVIPTYLEIANLTEEVLLMNPNAYLWGAIEGYLDLPITNTQYDFFTDLVPILPIILKGSLSYYTPYLNFNALGSDRLLMMVDFGVNPSYILTAEETYRMRYTPASVFYTTTLATYRDPIVETYTYLNGALSHVLGAMITARDVLSTGFVRLHYDNGVTIYVNYGAQAQTDGTVTVPARDYEVILP
jgi:hypothetical protein